MSDLPKLARHSTGDIFVCDITDAILKDDLASMEHPFYSLSKKPDREPRRYEHKGQWIDLAPVSTDTQAASVTRLGKPANAPSLVLGFVSESPRLSVRQAKRRPQNLGITLRRKHRPAG